MNNIRVLVLLLTIVVTLSSVDYVESKELKLTSIVLRSHFRLFSEGIVLIFVSINFNLKKFHLFSLIGL